MSGETRDVDLPDPQATEALGEALGESLAQRSASGAVVYLYGDLGAGKTTLVRGWLRGLGYQERVKSPTYTLVEPYEIPGRPVFHLDLYRLTDPEELEWIGIRELFAPDHLCLVEWPERGSGVLPPADLQIRLADAAAGPAEGRRASLLACSARGGTLLAGLPRDKSSLVD